MSALPPAGGVLDTASTSVRKRSIGCGVIGSRRRRAMRIHNPGFIRALGQRRLLSPEHVSRLRAAPRDGSYRSGPAAEGGVSQIGADRPARCPDDTRVLDYVLTKRLLDPRQVGELWARGLGACWVDLKNTLFQPEAIARLPCEFAKAHSVVPVYEMGGSVTVAFADPSDEHLRCHVAAAIGAKVSAVCAFGRDIHDAIGIQYTSLARLCALADDIDLSAPHGPEALLVGESQWERVAIAKPVAELLHGLLLLAFKERASDIHLEPFRDCVLVRFRLDGVINERLRISRDTYGALATRIKRLGGLAVADRRHAQEGTLTIELFRDVVDFRASTLPTVDGEKIVLRLLRQADGKGVPDLEDMEMAATVFEVIVKAVRRPGGMLIVSGPTGSGKTTTLFAALKSLDRRRLNVMTVEDPVEFRLSLTNQLQIGQADLDFPSALRCTLRQDPDVVLVGELRDLQTARVVTQAALSGRLVLTTMHSNDAVRALIRLLEIGLEPYMVGPVVNTIVAQRLVRRLCEACRVSYTLAEEEVRRYFRPDGRPVVFFRAPGCPTCNHTGYRGRLAIHEYLQVSEEIQELIGCRASPVEIRRAARQLGYRPLRYDGLKKVLRGLTTIEEIERVAMAVN